MVSKIGRGLFSPVVKTPGCYTISDRLPGSGGVGHDLPDAANKVGVDGVAGSGARGSLLGLRGGHGSLFYASSADSRDHGAHRWGQRDPSPICIEARAGAVHSHEEWEGNRGAGGPGDCILRQQTGDGRDPRVDPLAPPRSFPASHQAARQRRHGPFRQYKPSKRGRDARHHSRGHARRHGQGGAGRGARGGQRWHPQRRPAHSTTQEEARRHFHAGRTPGPHWGRGPPHSARR
jgi:hypothetical protein